MQTSDLSFLSGANGAFLEQIYEAYRSDPAAVDPSWRTFFEELSDAPEGLGLRAAQATGAENADAARRVTRDSLRVLMLIRAYRVRGHLIADLDPLRLESERHHPELDPATYGFTDSDFDRSFFIDGVLGQETATLRQILSILQQVYCTKIGVEFMHIQYPVEKSWIQQRVENTLNRTAFSAQERMEILDQLERSEGFERYLNLKYRGAKRFSIEGAESLVPAMESIIRVSSDLGVDEIVLGMPHRGRLNVLATVMGKSYQQLFAEFQGEAANPEDVQGSGDVKYHLGTSADRELSNGKPMHLSLTANPSHLEAVNPVVLGKVRAKQTMIGDLAHKRVMSILLHGDAAFAGQGLVAETFGLSELRGYRAGGTIHIIVNNQIGFTTSPGFSRSSPYPSDVGKMVQAPIIHVNGDDPEAVAHAAHFAAEYRCHFHRDVVLDIFCYRRYGHNEGDEPSFTQPLMYKKIAEHATTRQIYTQRLVTDGVLTAGEADKRLRDFHSRLDADFEASKGFRLNKADWLEGKWSGFEAPPEGEPKAKTAVPTGALKQIGAALCRFPEGFNAHRKIARFLETRRTAIETGRAIDWATAEALAFGTLLVEHKPVRLSGQDSGRGTFSQRHAVLSDQLTEERYIPLNNLAPDQARFEVIDSMLSEAAVLGFEYGYTLADPNCLVMWEAQFGDFANGAQVIIDQFISSGESKWLRMSGLVMLLPHGYEGQGPEHSSARLERYLQLFGDDNIQIANCTTPANHFHVLRRQLHRKYRKPLILMTPKSLLRHKRCVSKLAEFSGRSAFRRVLPESQKIAKAADVRRVVLCTGKVYYDLLEAREDRGIDDVAIVRIEQLAPFPDQSLAAELSQYGNADVVWCQEEPKNMGAWTFVGPRIEDVLGSLDVKATRPRYAGRDEAASPATGFIKVHQREQANLIDEALVHG